MTILTKNTISTTLTKSVAVSSYLLLFLIVLMLTDDASGFSSTNKKQLQQHAWQKRKVLTRVCAAATDGNEDVPIIILPQTTSAGVWTTAELMRRQTERRLIKQLLKGDEAIAELRRLWFSERGKQVQDKMYTAERAIGNPQNWTVAQSILEELVMDDPTYVEPFVRLSKLYCLQGRFEESQKICQAVLEIRPWHFVASETMAALSRVQVIEKEHLIKRLPTPSQKELRKSWVEQALEDSIQSEQDAMMTKSNIFRPDEEGASIILGLDDDNRSSWQ